MAFDAELVFGVDRSERLADRSLADAHLAAIARNAAKNYNGRLSVGSLISARILACPEALPTLAQRQIASDHQRLGRRLER